MSMDQASPPPAAALPRLSERHCAMLAEMGVPVWWSTGGTATVSDEPVRTAARPAPTPASPREPSPQRPPPPATPHAAPAAQPTPPVVWHTQRPDLPTLDRAALEDAIRACQRCDLGQRRQQAVPGMGDPAPDWLIVGEAPGEEEDRQGLPFVGKAGQLLDKMLAAMGLNRAQKVYIANVIKCRPPHNRNPAAAEISECSPYLLRQIDLLQPKIIVAMGRFAANTVLAAGGGVDAATLANTPLGKLRGQVHHAQLGGRTLPVVVTYHPSYLLRSPGEKGKAWADLCLALDTLEAL